MWSQKSVIKNLLRKLYNNVHCQTISNSGEYLFAGNAYGDIFVHNILNGDDNIKIVNSYDGVSNLKDINSLIYHESQLIVGSVGTVFSQEFNETTGVLNNKRKWEISLEDCATLGVLPDINSMWLSKDTNMLYVGCGNSKIYQIDLLKLCIVRTFEGHTQFVHCVVGQDEQIFSSSEDGTVRIWSVNTEKCISVLEPSQQKNLERPVFGSWVGNVSVKDNWLLCGGGPKLSLWHLPSMECVTDFAFPGKVHCCDIIDDRVIVAGEYNCAQLYSMQGKFASEIPLENSCTYSIAWQMHPANFMSIAGYSNHLHMLSDFRFLEKKVELYRI